MPGCGSGFDGGEGKERSGGDGGGGPDIDAIFNRSH